MRLLVEAGRPVAETLRQASYLFGHLDGLEEGNLPEVKAELPKQDEIFDAIITRLVAKLRCLWETEGRWASYDDIIPLGEIVFDALASLGVIVKDAGDRGAHITVPLRAETMFCKGCRAVTAPDRSTGASREPLDLRAR